tara:strand:- start:2769 stop:3242 length:474 start_codon:yes stop_codon:yes gene_type:complete
MDLSRLYFAIRDLNVTINYEKLINVLLKSCEGENPSGEILEAFTKADPKNKNQSKFLERLEKLGINLRVYDASIPVNSFSTEMATIAALSRDKSVTILSNDRSLIRVFDILEEKGISPTLCFFSEKLDKEWTPKILCGDTKFMDLSNPTIRKTITNN